MTSLITSNFSTELAKYLINSFDETDSYYIFAGKHTSDNVSITESNKNYIDIYNNIVFSKKIQKDDIKFMIRNIPWTTGKKYSTYSNTDTDLKNKDFFTVVDDGDEFNVYKCLDNANTVSTIPPSRSGNSMDEKPHITSDGYMWKYMFTIDNFSYNKFATRDFIPYIPNNSIITNSTEGTVDTIKIINSGRNFNNYISNAIFSSGDLSIGGDNTVYGAPTSASNINDYYKGCVLRIKSGLGIDQYRRIIGYDGSSLQKKFILDKPFTILPESNDTYEVYPYVYIWGDGNETIASEGIAYINSTANSISSISVLNSGKGYRKASATIGNSPKILFDNSGTNSNITFPSVITQDSSYIPAVLEPIISPIKGHGNNPIEELFANKIGIGIKINQTESGTIPIENDFKQIGIIKNPLFDNVSIFHDTSKALGSFSIGEELVQFNNIKLNGTFTSNTANNIIEKISQGKLSSQISIINAGTGYDTTSNNQLVFNNSGTGGSGATGTFTVNANGAITSATVSNTGSGYITSPSISINPTAAATGSLGQLSIALANPESPLLKDSFIVGENILVSSISNNFISTVNTIPENYRIELTNNVPFTSNSISLSKLKITAKGIISSLSSGRIVLTNVSGKFTDNSKIIGMGSSAVSEIKASNSTFNAVTLNDKSSLSFNTPVQLTRLEGNFTSGSATFIEDEVVLQESNIIENQPKGILHHVEINEGTDDDIIFLTNTTGNFDTTSIPSKLVKGNTSLATFDNINNKYRGDFVKDSGQILYYESIDPIKRSGNKSEVIKITIAL